MAAIFSARQGAESKRILSLSLNVSEEPSRMAFHKHVPISKGLLSGRYSSWNQCERVFEQMISICFTMVWSLVSEGILIRKISRVEPVRTYFRINDQLLLYYGMEPCLSVVLPWDSMANRLATFYAF